MDLTYKYYRKLNSKTAYLVLHGGGPEGIETPFISNVIDSLIGAGESVFGFNFPYCERGESSSSGPDLKEETDALQSVVGFLRGEGYKQIIIVAKSLGGIVTSFWLGNGKVDAVKVVVLGYVIGSVKTENLNNNLSLVIQGENDRFGNAQAVKDELRKNDVSAQVVEVPNADHSYRNEQKKPIYQKQAIELLLQNLKTISRH